MGESQGQGTVPGASLTLTFTPVMQRQKDNLALPSAEHQAIGSGQAGVETWKYKAKNSLMYYPEGEQAALSDCVFGPGLQAGVSVPPCILGLGGVLVCHRAGV